MNTWTVVAEPEVAEWYAGLNDAGTGQADVAINRLEREGVLLGEPYTRQLDGKLRELRLMVAGRHTRVTYYVGTSRRIVLLTVFTKTQRREAAQIARAVHAMVECIDNHGHDEGS